MFNSKSETNFNVALVALAEQVGADRAIEIFFDVLDRRVESNRAEKIEKDFFKEIGLNPGKYENYRFSNEAQMRKMLIAKLEAIMRQPRIL